MRICDSCGYHGDSSCITMVYCHLVTDKPPPNKMQAFSMELCGTCRDECYRRLQLIGESLRKMGA